MDEHSKKLSWLVALLSSAMAALSVLVYVFWRPFEGTRFGELILHAIPEALVVFCTFPVVYFAFTSRGIYLHESQKVNLDELAKAVASQVADLNSGSISYAPTPSPEHMKRIEAEVAKIGAAAVANNSGKHVVPHLGRKRDMLIVVDVQKDFFDGGKLPVVDTLSLLPLINDAIEKAEKEGALIVYAQDWHPPNHKSFKSEGGAWPPHCLEGSDGAKLHPDLKIPSSYETFHFGTDPSKEGYSPFENNDLVQLVCDENIGDVFVCGIATEYCVLATCIEAKRLGKTTAIIETLVRSAEPEKQAESLGLFDQHRIHRYKESPWA